MATAYFAYGTNMSRAQMAYRCPGAGWVDAAVLRGHRFRITRQGFATVVPDPGSDVHGVLWVVTDEDERALDRYEGVGEGLYRRERRRVHVRLGMATDPVDALVYVANDLQGGQPRIGYLEQVVAGGEAHGLPDDYLAELRNLRLTGRGSR